HRRGPTFGDAGALYGGPNLVRGRVPTSGRAGWAHEGDFAFARARSFRPAQIRRSNPTHGVLPTLPLLVLENLILVTFPFGPSAIGPIPSPQRSWISQK